MEALRGLDLRVPAGSIFGFLGTNGAGKTTTMKVLLGMVHPTAGEARVFGLPCAGSTSGVEIRRRSAFVSDEKDLYDYMTVGDMIAFTRSFFPRWRTDLEQRYVQKFDLSPSRSIKGLSRGMRTKVALLLALCRGADLLLLDEPTSGLDPAMAEEVLQALVAHVSREEAMVFDGEAPQFHVHAPGMHRVRRQGRVVTVLSSSNDTAVIDELRGYRPVALDVLPVTLKDIFLESVRTED